MKNLSSKRQVLQAEYRKTLQQIAEERKPYCEGCGSNQGVDPSHRIARSRNINFLAVKENIDLYCTKCHKNYETSKFWLLNNGYAVKEWLKENDYELYVKKTEKEQVNRLFDFHLSRNIRNLTSKLRELNLPDNTLEKMESAGLIRRLHALEEVHFERIV